VKWNASKEHIETFFPTEMHLFNQPMKVIKATDYDVVVEWKDDTLGFMPDELELTSKLHEILE
jgi:hypothetical protein